MKTWRTNIHEAAAILRATGLSTLRISANALDACAPQPGQRACSCRDGHGAALRREAYAIETLASYSREEETLHAETLEQAWNLVADAADQAERVRRGEDEHPEAAA